MNNSLKTVGFIGTGLMGLPMAKNILKKNLNYMFGTELQQKHRNLKKREQKFFKI